MTMSSKEKPTEDMTETWTAEETIQLFLALAGLKPVGVNKHFYMACIVERLSKSLNRDIPAEAIWTYLRTLYNLEVLDELEPIPFPNDQKDFSLPDTEFSALMSRKQAEHEEKKQNTDTPRTVSTASVSNSTTQNNSKHSEKQSNNKITATPSNKDLEKKISSKLIEIPKRTPKRTRGSMSLESNSPSTTPPPLQSNKRRRI